MVTANNYVFRPVTGHHHVHPIKRGWGLYNKLSNDEISFIVSYTL